MMKIAVFGNYGVKNVGDDLILKGLQEHYREDELLVFCGHPTQVRKQFGLASHSFFPGGVRSWLRSLFFGQQETVQESLKILKSVDRILIGGGGILVDHHLKAVVLWWCQLRMIRKSGIPFEFVGNSFELRKWWSRLLFKPFLRSAAAISVRDSSSRDFVESLGLNADLIEDFSSCVPLPMMERAPKKIIALSLCRWGIGDGQKSALREFVREKKQEGYVITGLAFQTVGDDDRSILSEIDPEMAVQTELSDILESLRTCEGLVAMRYHAVLLGLRFNIPVLALSYQEKVSNLMKDKKLLETCVPIQNIDEQMLQELFLKAVEGGGK